MSVLYFPLQKQLVAVFQKPEGDFGVLESVLWLTSGPYNNPYELMTFYDNHDMARFNGSDEAFIDVHNWLFTARGIPVVYYGSEIGFMRGRAEHAGNRNYYGQARIDAAAQSPIFAPLQRIASLRRASPALQRGLQLNLVLEGDRAAFYRVYQRGDVAQTALVLLNKGADATRLVVDGPVQRGTWRDGFDGSPVEISDRIDIEVPAHGVRVLLRDAPLDDAGLLQTLTQAMAGAHAGGAQR